MANADVKSDLTATDGLCNIWLEFDGLDVPLGSADANVRFRFINREDGHESVMAVLSFPINAGDDGLSGMIARAHDALIDVLRQALYSSDKMRTHYRKTALR